MNRSQIFTLAHQNARKLRDCHKTYRGAFREALKAIYDMIAMGAFKPITYEDVFADLSIAARRAQQFAATAKQIAYLASLAVKTGECASGLIVSGIVGLKLVA